MSDIEDQRLLDTSIAEDSYGVSPIAVAWKHIDEMEKKMVIPEMPDGYVLMQDTGFWYVLKDEGIGMKRLLDKEGNEMRFEPTTASLAQARVYAQNHKAAGLKASQAVPEDEP